VNNFSKISTTRVKTLQ